MKSKTVVKIENGLSDILRILAQHSPRRTQVRLKSDLTPFVLLDYDPSRILMHADSEMGLYRARACWKEPETVRWIEENIHPGDVFYDIGTNVGAYALVASKHCGDKLTVHAFEPSFSTYALLCRNIIANQCQHNIYPHSICLTDAPRLLTFNYASLEGGSALHTLESNVVDAFGKRFAPVFRQRLLGFSIDYLVSKMGFPIPDHIKLDVDGTEMDILRGATQTLPNVTSLLIETSEAGDQATAVTAFLQRKGYQLSSRVVRAQGEICNFIFKRNL